ncbi:MAG: hypothetical protein OES47_03285 [Acidobacteriota bacterium]|nr:hypothetical protein [Acidobacteriota bacterium]
MLDELREPLEDHDPEHAEKLCAEIARAALGDFAPALLLIPAATRRRIRVLTSFSLTLFDFALQRGLQGDRLAGINRWEFALEQALEGEPAGQPIFVLMAAEERLEPWRREALDRLFAIARRRAMGRQSAGDADLRTLSNAFAEALVGKRLDPRAGVFGAALIRLRALREEERPAPQEELDRFARSLEAGSGPLPPPWGRVARFLQLAALRLARTSCPLGFATRMAFLLRARLF